MRLTDVRLPHEVGRRWQNDSHVLHLIEDREEYDQAMAEPVIGGLGLLGLLTLFQTCNSAYDVFVRSAQNLGKDYYRTSVLLDIERQKLRLWGQYLGISPSQQCRLLRSETPQTQEIVVKMLESIQALLGDSRVLMARYDVRISEASQTSTGAAVDIDLQGLDLEGARSCPAIELAQVSRRETERSVKASTSRLLKIKWALSDNAKFNRIVEDLRSINDNLWVCLPVNRWLALAKGLPSVILPSINDRAMLSEVESNPQGGQICKVLSACADLRRTALAIEETNPSFGESLRWNISQVQNPNPAEADRPSRRHLTLATDAEGNTKLVLVEWRQVDSNPDSDENDKGVIRRRIKALAFLLGSARATELGLMRCVGFFQDSHVMIERYGLLLERPTQDSITRSNFPTSFRLQSLYDFIDKNSTTPVLGDRFRIASHLCNVILQIHASNWLHKNISSQNVIFIKGPESSRDGSDISLPYLVGFDFSRPDCPSALSLEYARDPDNVYRHPALWPANNRKRPRFCKEYDIFALGVVLWEVGLWRIAHKCCTSRDMRSPEAWKAFLMKKTPRLGSKCGQIYQNVVESCLNGPFIESVDKDTKLEPGTEVLDLHRSFLFDVVYQLAKCYA